MKKVLFHPEDVKDKLAEAKALAALYDFEVGTSIHVQRGKMYVCNVDEEMWKVYDESRRGRYLPGEQL